MRVRTGATAAALLLAMVGSALVLGVTPAAAAESSTISFVTASPVQTAFGGNWNAQLITRMPDYSDAPIPADQGTVDVFLDGAVEPFAARLPIQPDGSVYVSAPAASNLAPGEYELTAAFVPHANSYVGASTTPTPLIVQVASYAVDATIRMDDASVAAETPVIEARLSGQFVETTGAVPAGTWTITVDGPDGTVVETEVAQAAGADDALRYEITADLEKGTDYTVQAQFTPIEALEAGLEVTQPTELTFRTPGGTLADPVPYPLWLLILTCLVPLGLAVTVIVLSVRISRRSAVAAAVGTGAVDTAPVTDPMTEEPAWDPFATAQAEPEAATRLLPPVAPTPQTPPDDWSLADQAEGTPTELIDPHDQRDPNDLR